MEAYIILLWYAVAEIDGGDYVFLGGEDEGTGC